MRYQPFGLRKKDLQRKTNVLGLLALHLFCQVACNLKFQKKFGPNFTSSSWVGVRAKQTNKLLEIASVKWTGKVPVLTANTETCKGQESAALLQ
jgi:hypothetical protein